MRKDAVGWLKGWREGSGKMLGEILFSPLYVHVYYVYIYLFFFQIANLLPKLGHLGMAFTSGYISAAY
jgi:hypothetical protein